MVGENLKILYRKKIWMRDWQIKLTVICVWSMLAMGPQGFAFCCFGNLPREYSLARETKDVRGWNSAPISGETGSMETWTYLTLQTKEAKNTLSSADLLFSGSAWNVLSSATVNGVLFPAFDDLYSRKFLFLV